jgi:dipeptidyl aminopeptidase/acylaminoacyl peptidase
MKSIKSGSSHDFGNWPSPIGSGLIASNALQLDELRIYGDALWWLERHPEQGGRVDIAHHANDTTRALLPREYSCRSRVHEYGGGSYCISHKGIYFVNDADQDIYFLAHADAPVQRITRSSDTRYADLSFDFHHNRLICIQEQHCDNDRVENSLLAINTDTGSRTVLASGDDFYSSPKPCPDGSRLAWLSWNHPDMPWDTTQLWLAELSDNGNIISSRVIAGGESVSVFQPEWSAAGALYFIDDRTGWWNLYHYDGQHAHPAYNCQLEFGLPQWVFGLRCYSFIDTHRIVCSVIDAGVGKLGILDTHDGEFAALETGYNRFSSINASADCTCFIGASDSTFSQVVRLDLKSARTTPLKYACTPELDSRYFSSPQSIEFSTRHGDTAHAIYYPPHNPDVTPDTEQKPPLIVITHGGPTACNDATLDLRKQFWTSRGYAVLDVNYSGSTGYGRRYRDRLLGQWGIRDAEDCCDAARYMVDAGLADAQRLIIKGSSAGGYTVLCALTFHDVFSAGASYYGIGELEALAKHTHKFEAHYLDRLVGPYPLMREIYAQRSPINYIDQLNCPVIFFQGLDDRVVPREQAEMMFNALRQKGVPTSYIEFTGEAHGFRKADTITACLRAELEFYARILGLPLDNECTGTLAIENLPI